MKARVFRLPAAVAGDHHVHILLLGLSPIPVGGYKVAYEYANALVAAGARVTVWHSRAFYADVPGGSRHLKLIKAYARMLLSRVRSRGGMVTWFRFDPRVVVRVSGGYPSPRLTPADAVIATAVETTPYAARLARRWGAKSAALIQHYEIWAASRDFILEAWAGVNYRIVIAPWLQDLCTAAALTSQLIPNAIDPRGFPPGPPLRDRRPVVLTLLSPHGYKRSDVVTDTLERLHQMSPAIELHAFGQEKRPATLPEFVVYHENPEPEVLAALYRSARVYLCGSDSEGWHLPPAEATFSGAAVVSTDIGGVRASMQNDALYVRAGDAEGLAALAASALEDTAAAQDRVDRAARRLRSRTYADNVTELTGALGWGEVHP